jgi:hypothetical protein
MRNIVPGPIGGPAVVPPTISNLWDRPLQHKFRSQITRLGSSATFKSNHRPHHDKFVVGEIFEKCPVLSNRRGLHHSTWLPSCAVSDCTRLLYMRCQRPRNRRAAEQRDELAPDHSITSSARASTVAGTSRPSALAVLRLIASSYFVGA